MYTWSEGVPCIRGVRGYHVRGVRGYHVCGVRGYHVRGVRGYHVRGARGTMYMHWPSLVDYHIIKLIPF